MRVSLFIPCVVESLLPGVGEAAAQVLWQAGAEVSYAEEQTCCGQPAFNAGRWEEARKVARHFLRTFREAELIVSPSGSCVSMVRNHYARLFADRPEELAVAQSLAERTFEFTEFLLSKLSVTDFGSALSGRVTYHDSCHMNRELGLREEPRELLRRVKGIELVEMVDADRCCGFGGVFSVKFPALSTAMAKRKLERIQAAGVEAVVTADPGCMIQLSGYFHRQGVPIRVLHLAEVLAAAGGRLPSSSSA